jgi:metal-responsive CopG/Arc/MetJ family transcriptional regulator
MGTVKVTFTLDEATIKRLNETAQRLAKPKSEVVREAILDYHGKSDRLSEPERQRMLRLVQEIAAQPRTRSSRSVDRELREIRASRHKGWQRPTD